jgi:hypothetical protein
LGGLRVVILLTLLGVASAQTDEIQVYDGGLAAVGTFNLTWHRNFTPRGLATPAFPGAIVADNSFNGVHEWALGVTPCFQAGLYPSLYSRDKDAGWGFDASSCGHCSPRRRRTNGDKSPWQTRGNCIFDKTSRFAAMCETVQTDCRRSLYAGDNV